MADESASESRPISVSEILARSREAGDAAVRPSREGRGRRRAGRDGAVSVSELTGEIPRISDTGSIPATPRSAAAAPPADPSVRPHPAETGSPTPTPAPTPAPSPSPSSAAPSAPTQPPAEVPADQGSGGGDGRSETFPRASNPVPRRQVDDVASVDRWAGPGETAPDNPDSQLSRPRFAAGGAPESSQPGGRRAARQQPPQPEVPPMSRDFSADAVARRLRTSDSGSRIDDEIIDERAANAVTGIIPVVGDRDDVVVVDPEDEVEAADLPSQRRQPGSRPGSSRQGDFSEIVDDDFDAYRSFADVDDDEDEAPRRGLSRWLKDRKDGDKKGGDTKGGDTKGGDTKGGDTKDKPASTSRLDLAAASRPDVTGEAVTDEATESSSTTGGPAASDRRAPMFGTATGGFPAASGVDPLRAGRAAGGTDSAATSSPDQPDTATSEDDSTTASPLTAATSKSVLSDSASSTAALSDPSSSTDKVSTGTSQKDEASTSDRSPVLAWAQVAGEAIVGLAVGIGLFWGFTELWKWNVYFALVLAVVVIFGIVTLAHIVRRSRDLTTTLLAMGVGLIVTIGPLVLLAT